jgi:predicted Rossmann fold nucleotide-binding protein DprA/Smf involved in DNA uptake
VNLRIVSGGQTGVDRAALDVALRLGIPAGGWCPRGRLAEDGLIPAAYPLRETVSDDYAERTRLNVRDSDGTLVLSVGPATGGTALTLACCRMESRPVLHVRLGPEAKVESVRSWLRYHGIQALNVAGPRESIEPGVQAQAAQFLESLLLSLR